MKKLSLLLILFLFGCQKTSVKDKLYISSIGIDFIDNKYKVHLYSEETYGKSVGDNLLNIFLEMERGASKQISYEHLKSIGFSTSFLDLGEIDKQISFFKENHRFTINCYMFISDDLNTLYQNKNQPLYIRFSKDDTSIVTPILFVEFMRSYYEKYRYIGIPYLSTKKNVWDDNNIICSGACFLKKDYFLIENEDLQYIYKNIFLIEHENLVLEISNYYYGFMVKERQLFFRINCDVKCLVNDEELSDEKVSKIIDEYLKNKIEYFLSLKIDIFNIKDYLYRRGYDIMEVKQVLVDSRLIK